MDFHGQKKAELVIRYLLFITFVIAFVASMIMESLLLFLEIVAGGSIITALAVIPNHVCYNRNPIVWLPEQSPAPPLNTHVIGSDKKLE